MSEEPTLQPDASDNMNNLAQLLKALDLFFHSRTNSPVKLIVDPMRSKKATSSVFNTLMSGLLSWNSSAC